MGVKKLQRGIPQSKKRSGIKGLVGGGGVKKKKSLKAKREARFREMEVSCSGPLNQKYPRSHERKKKEEAANRRKKNVGGGSNGK